MTDRILTTHVGSLVRPPELVDFIRTVENGEPYEPHAFEELLRRSVAEVVRRQAEVGIDIVSDGEFGKTWTWAWYVRDRLGGFEERPWGPEGEREPARTGKDRREFAEFYAEYVAQHQTGAGFRQRGQWVCVGPIEYQGQAAVQRDIDDLKAAAAAAGALDAFLPVAAPASVMPVRTDEYYASEEEFLFALADALNHEYRRGRLGPADLDRRRVPRDDVRHDGSPGHPPGVPRVGGVAHRGPEPRAGGHPGGAVALPRVLGELERAAHRRRGAARHRRPHPEGARRRLLARAGESPPRA